MSAHKIDVHILHLPDENQQWWEECQASLEGHPINIYNCEGILNNTNEARKRGYSLGSAPYVSFVDPDDIVLPHAFEKCLEVLETTPNICGVYTLCDVMDPDGNSIDNHVKHPYREWSMSRMNTNLLEIHQLCVVKRECVEYYYTNQYHNIPHSNVYENMMMYVHLGLRHPWKAIDYVGYKWRKGPNGTHTGNTTCPITIHNAFNYIKQIIKNSSMV